MTFTLGVEGCWIDCRTINSAVGLCGVHERSRQKDNHVERVCETTCLDIVGLMGWLAVRAQARRGMRWLATGPVTGSAAGTDGVLLMQTRTGHAYGLARIPQRLVPDSRCCRMKAESIKGKANLGMG